MAVHCYNLPKSAKAGAKGGGPTPVQCNRQPDNRHPHLPLKSVGQLNLPSGMHLALVQICHRNPALCQKLRQPLLPAKALPFLRFLIRGLVCCMGSGTHRLLVGSSRLFHAVRHAS